MHHSSNRIAHTTAFVKPVVEHWLEPEIAILYASSHRQDNTYNEYYDDDDKKGSKEMFYLTTHSTHFIYGYMASDIW